MIKEQSDPILEYINGIRLCLRGDLDDLSILGFNQEKFDELADRDIYLTRSDGILINNQGVLFVGPNGAGKSTICKKLEDEIKATYFLGGDEYYSERGILLAQEILRIFPVNPTKQNKTLYEGGVPITDIIYVEKEDFDSSSISNVDVVNSQRLYGYLLMALCSKGDDFVEDKAEESLRYVSMLLKQAPPDVRHYQLINATGCFEQTIELIKKRVIQNSYKN